MVFDMTTSMHRAMRSSNQRTRDRADEVKNNAGGYVFQIDPLQHLKRFIILGTEGGTYYQSERAISKQAQDMVIAVIQSREIGPSELVTNVCEWGSNAAKRTYALWTMAAILQYGTNEHKVRVKAALPLLVKTGTDLFEFVSYVESLGGWGNAKRAAVENVLRSHDVNEIGLWAVKYRDRHGWTWRDVLRVVHPASKGSDPRWSNLFDFMLGKELESTGILPVDGFIKARGVTNGAELVDFIEKYGLPWEALTDEQRTDDVWKAVLPFIGNQAVLRNLAQWTRRGLSNDLQFASFVHDRLIRSKNLHPLKLLDALKTYGSGGAYGRSRGGAYVPFPAWRNGIERALQESFTTGVTPANKRVFVGLDVSGSMDAAVSGSAVLSCREAGAAIALAVAKNEPGSYVYGFTAVGDRWGGQQAMTDLRFSEFTSYADALNNTSRLNFGRTDCALPMLFAAQNRLNVDTFVVITDNQTWAGDVKPAQALRDYRKSSGIPAKLAVIAMTGTKFSIADPTDPGMMDFVGFSTDLPEALRSFMTL